MREFVYYSKNAVTAGNFIKDDLVKAGRMDIVCNVILQALFVSRHMREDVKVHLVFDGPPDAPKHLELFPAKNLEGGEGKIDISKKDIAGLIKRMLYKYRKGERVGVAEGYFIEKKSFEKLLVDLDEEGKNVLVLDSRGKDIRDLEMKGNEVFVIGDHDGFPTGMKKFLRRIDKISVGPRVLFASQVVTILHNEIDRRGEF